VARALGVVPILLIIYYQTKAFCTFKNYDSPTYQYPTVMISHSDIAFISQVYNCAIQVTIQDCILGIRNSHFD